MDVLNMLADPIWTPSSSRIERAPLTAFTRIAAAVSGRRLETYGDLYRWSVEQPEMFWSLVWSFCDVIGEPGKDVLVNGHDMRAARFFPDAALNFAENLLRCDGDATAIVFRGEDKVELRLSWKDLQGEVSKLQQYLLAVGVRPGDRVAAMIPNMPEAVIGLLAASSIGAVWASCSPDFGVDGVVDRFGQIEPKVLITVDGYWYGGKAIAIDAKVKAIAEQLSGLGTVLVVDYLGTARDVASRIDRATAMADALAPFEASAPSFARLPFSHPLCIMFSSGTTGKPKCIVHAAGGILLQHLKEHRLHSDIRFGDRVFYYSTCGWMMWNWLVSGLASGATLLLYDGSPGAPTMASLFDYAAAERATFFGTSAKFIEMLSKSGIAPARTHRLDALRTLASTGSPLSPEGFRYIHDGIKSDLHVASISGGTDIVSCFVLGVPTEAVFEGEIQDAGLGMAVEIWNNEGLPVVGEKGELVCSRPFPCMPLAFWNDPDGTKYRSAYFDRFDNIWCHGDFAERTPNGGIIIHGRSDTTLNPGGVRIGTAEIYNQLDRVPEVIEGLCIGQEWEGDVRIVLFVRLVADAVLDAELERRLKSTIREGASPRHVPGKIVRVDDLPRTRSGKITELAVREVVHGRPVVNREALANPEALELFRNLPILAV